ncbi:MAG: sporulation integral membrane protein YlbJ [Tissierellaceae bacterium]|nr:sporulation integral membrane protein YlbJ [Tissierellaceae bacterium]
MNIRPIKKKYYSKIPFLFVLLIILQGIISNPLVSIQSASQGALMWFNVILPSLLPFFIISELLISLGFIDIIGKILSPLMRPIFNTPGEGIFPLSMSMLSGYPVGSKLTSRLREKNLITQIEGNRLLCFTSTSGPIFMLGAVAIGMLKDSNLGPLIILPHYISIIILGLVFRFYKYDAVSNKKYFNAKMYYKNINISINQWLKTRKSISSLITISIKESMDTILLIGGIVIFYSVVVEILFNMGIINQSLVFLSKLFSAENELLKGIVVGIFEMTLGCKVIAYSNINILNKIIVINFIIGWGGLSVHSQAMNFLKRTDLNLKLFTLSKMLHGLLSSIISYVLYITMYKDYVYPATYNYPYASTTYSLMNWFSILLSASKLALFSFLFIFIVCAVSFVFS